MIMLAVAAGTVRAADEAKPARPNFVFILSDDQRWDTLGVSGNSKVHTPALDALAKEGVHFRQATAYVSQCTPSRSTLLTGLTPHEHKWYSNQNHAKEVSNEDGFRDYVTLPRLLRDNGYRTVLVGKWHIDPAPWNCGFSDVRVWMPVGGGPFTDPSLAQGNSKKTSHFKGYTNEIFAEDGIEFLKSDAAKERPFFLWLALTAPHDPMYPNPPRIEKLYEGKQTKDLLPPGFPADVTPGDFKRYYEACSLVDDISGRVIETLKERGLYENTVVVLLGDNGFMMGRRGIASEGPSGKVVPYEDSIRVPWVMRVPGQKIHGTSEALVSSLDLPVTFAKLAGIEPPKQWNGRNLVPLLQGEDAKLTEQIHEFADNKSDKFGHLAHRLIRTNKYKLIVWEKSGEPAELYNLPADPGEEKNVADDPAMKDVRADLTKRLAAWLAKTNDPAVKWIEQ